LTIAGDPPPEVEDALARRAAQIGIGHISADFQPGAHARAKVELVARVYVAVPPACPQTAHLNIMDGDNKISSDWGCATVSDLELQVADPRDLLEGQSGGETDAVLTSAAITRLQTDKVKKLEGPSTTAPVTNATGVSQ
jgi:type IV pilus biogenesis protein CpaD/CtpE